MATQNATGTTAERQEPQVRCYLVIPDFVCDMIEEGKLDAAEAYLLATIHSYSRKGEGCFASNAYLAKRCGFQIQWVQRRLARFIEMGLVDRVGGENGERRYLFTKWDWYNPMSSQPPPPVQPATHINKEDNAPQKTRCARLSGGAKQKRATSVVQEHHRHWAARLRAVTLRRYKDKWSHSGWADQFRMAENSFTRDEVERVLSWYEKNAGTDPFVIRNAKNFRAQFHVLQGKMKRDPAHDESPSHKDTAAVLKRLDRLRWPRALKDQLPRCVSAALRNLDRFHGQGTDTRLPPRLAKLFKYLDDAIGTNTRFVAEELEGFHSWVEKKGATPKHLPQFGWGPKGLLTRRCEKLAEGYTMNEDAVTELLEALDL